MAPSAPSTLGATSLRNWSMRGLTKRTVQKDESTGKQWLEARTGGVVEWRVGVHTREFGREDVDLI